MVAAAALVDPTPPPALDLSMIYGISQDPVDLTYTSYAPPVVVPIDINMTPITDGTNVAYLSSIIKQVTATRLVLDAGAHVTDGTNEAPFDFEYDTEGEKFGAGTAFLQA